MVPGGFYRKLGCFILAVCGTFTAHAAEFQARLAYVAQPSNPLHAGMVKFSELVSEYSEGRVAINLFHSGQLGGERDYIEGLQLGSIQFAATSTGALSAFEEKVAVFSLPFIFSSTDHFDSVVDGEIGDNLATGLLKKNLRVLGYLDFGTRYIANSKKIVKVPADLHGLKMRIVQDPVMLETYSVLGARAFPMARTEVYTALKQGVLDGLDNSLPFYESMGDYEVANFLTLGVPIFQTVGAIMVSEPFYAKLPPELQAAVSRAAKEAIPEQRRLFREADAEVLERLTKKGVVAEEADPQPFQEIAVAVWKKFESELGGPDIIRAVTEVSPAAGDK